MTQTFQIGFLLYPNLTQLDLTGPAQFLSRAPGARVHYVWKSLDPVPSDAGLSLMPTATFETCPALDMICVPGGPGQVPLMRDAETLAFLRRQADGARFVTSVCTGSLVLGAAGLLAGYRATSHWMWLDSLAAFGAVPVAARVVKDRNRITGGGVTAGIDFALTVIAEVWGEAIAKQIQLFLEYDPQPPFACGSPSSAEPAIVAAVRAQAAEARARREVEIRAAAEQVGRR